MKIKKILFSCIFSIIAYYAQSQFTLTISNVSINPTLTCNNPSVILVGSVVSTGGAYYTSWYCPNGLTVSGVTVAATLGGIYTFQVRDDNTPPRFYSKTYTVQSTLGYPKVVNPSPVPLPCPGNITITPMVQPPVGSYTYTWTAPQGASVQMVQNNLITAVQGDYTLTVSDASTGCTNSGIIGVWSCVGINENTKKEEKISVWPNPFNDRFAIHFQDYNEPISIELFNCYGEYLKKQTVNSNSEIDMRGFNSGLYYIKIAGHNKLIKLIKS